MTVSVIVAFRDTGPGWRTKVWDLVRTQMQNDHPDFEIVVGTDDGVDPFWKTLALNRAADKATGDILFLTDTDTYIPPAQVDAAVAGMARDDTHWWRPWQRKLKLAERPTRDIVKAGRITGDFERMRLENRNTYWAAPPLLVPRWMFWDVGAMDTRFRGWSSEDEAFGRTLRCLHGNPMSITGDCIHLWHQRIGRSGNDLWPGQVSTADNIALGVEYRKASRNEHTMRELLGAR